MKLHVISSKELNVKCTFLIIFLHTITLMLSLITKKGPTELLQNRKLLCFHLQLQNFSQKESYQGAFTSGYSSDQSRQSSNNSFPSPAPKFLHNSKPIKDFTSASSSLWLNQDHHPEKNIPILESRKLSQYYY